MKNLIDMIFTEFWLNENDKKSMEIQNKYYKIIYQVCVSYTIFIMIVLYILLLTPLMTQTRVHPIRFWTPGDIIYMSPYYELVYGAQWIITNLSVCSGVIMSHIFFSCMVMYVYVQFELLNLKISGLSDIEDSDEAYEVLKKCVKHHNVILK